jgi:phage anti-repressor protein
MINSFDSSLGQSVYSTELYDYLELTQTYYSRFIKKEIFNNPYCVENQDYCINVQVNNSAGNFRKEIVLHIDFAKKLCMTSKSKKGNEIRNELIKLTKQVENKDLLTHEQVLYLTALKSFFKFVENQKKVKSEHLNKFVSESKKYNPYAEFHNWRNSILGIEKNEIDKMITEFTVKNQKQINSSISKDRIINLLDSYSGLKNAVWDFLNIKGEVNSLKLAELVKNMAKVENLSIFQKNENNLFQQKENINELKILNK